MDKEKKSILKVLNSMMGDGKPTKVIKKTLGRAMRSKEAVNLMIGSEEDPTVGAFLKETARLVYGLMDQIEKLEEEIGTLKNVTKFQREDIEILRAKLESKKE